MALFDDVRRRVLDNGLEILVREDRSAPVVALNFFVRVGSLNEDEAIAGWSHGIEHMLFKGTDRRGPGDIAREIADAGGDTNAGTGYESTNYYIILPSRNFDTALDIHADVLQHSTFDEFELEKERQVLIKENEMYRDRPNGFGFTWEALLAEAFQVHRYQRPIGGPDENLLRVGREEIVRFKEQYYVPNNLTYVVVGDVDAEEVFRKMEAAFGGWARGDLKPDLSDPEPPQDIFRLVQMQGDVEKQYVKIGFHIPPELDPETDALLVLSHILGSGRSSRLYRRVREDRGLILSSNIMESTGRDPGYMVIEFVAEPEKARAALDAVIAEILTFQEEPVSREELERTLRAVESDTLYTLETMEGQAQMLGHYALLGDYRRAGAYLERIAAVTPARIQAAARTYLNLEQATILSYAPAERGPWPEDAAALFRHLRENAVPAPPGTPAPAPESPSAAVMPSGSGTARGPVTAHTLPGGARILLQPDGRLPLVALSAVFPHGSGDEPASQAGITRLLQTSMMKGSGGRSAAEIAGALDRMGARLRPFTDRDLLGFSLGAMRDDLPEALDLFETVLARPDLPAAAVEQERDRTLVEIASMRDDTVPYTVSEFFSLIFPDHGYGRPVIGTEAAVAALTPEDLRARHRAVYDPARLVLAVVGDFETDRILPRLERILDALPSGNGAPAPVERTTGPTRPARREHHQSVAQAVVVLGVPGPTLGGEDRYAFDVWNAVLSGMGNRLFASLRDEQHLCYFTGSFVASYREGGAVGAYVGTGPDQVDQATDGLIRELERSVAEPPTGEELRRAHNTLAGNYLVGMQTRMAWASTYAQDEIQGLGYEEASRYVEAIRRVTSDDVRDAAARYLDRERMAIAVLRPTAEPVGS